MLLSYALVYTQWQPRNISTQQTTKYYRFVCVFVLVFFSDFKLNVFCINNLNKYAYSADAVNNYKIAKTKQKIVRKTQKKNGSCENPL